MKSLEIPAGGMPFTGDDLLWMQAGLTEGIKALCQPYLVDGKAIIAGMGMRIVSGSIVIDPGWIFINNELLSFAGATIAGEDLTAHELYSAGDYDPAGNDVFADSISRDTYFNTTAKHRAYTSPGAQKIRLSDLDKYRISLRSLVYKYTIYETLDSKLVVSRAGNVVSLNGWLGESFPMDELIGLPINQADRPTQGLFLGSVHRAIFYPENDNKSIFKLNALSGLWTLSGDSPSNTNLNAAVIDITWQL